MNKIFTLFGAGIAGALLVESPVLAQQNAPMPTPVVEIIGCNFKPSKGMDDLHAVTARWNAWADKNNIKDYTAFIATPYLYSTDLKYDALWLGAWPNGTAMGVDEALWFTQGKELIAAYDAVADCSSHAQYAEVVIKAPQGPPPQNGVAVFSDCTVRDGRTVDEAITALQKFHEYAAGRGSDPFEAVFFSIAGQTNDSHYTFKTVTGFDSIQAYGKGVDVYSGGGFLRAEELFGRLLECNSSRVYALERVRAAAPPQ